MKIIKIRGNSSELSLHLSHPIMLDENERYKIGLVGFYSYNNTYNVCKKCKLFFHFYDRENRSIMHAVGISKGYWTLKDMEKYVQDELSIISKTKSAEPFAPSKFTISLVNNHVKITSPLLVELDKKLEAMLGFDDKPFLSATGRHIPRVRPFDVIEVHCNLTESSISNHKDNPHDHEESQILYSFFPNIPFGYKISERPDNVLYVPLTDHIRKIDSIKLTLRNEQGDILDNGEVGTTTYLSLIRD